jgi:hypothetical protein
MAVVQASAASHQEAAARQQEAMARQQAAIRGLQGENEELRAQVAGMQRREREESRPDPVPLVEESGRGVLAPSPMRAARARGPAAGIPPGEAARRGYAAAGRRRSDAEDEVALRSRMEYEERFGDLGGPPRESSFARQMREAEGKFTAANKKNLYAAWDSSYMDEVTFLAEAVLPEECRGRDLDDRPLLWALVQLAGFNDLLKQQGRYRLDLDVAYFMEDNMVVAHSPAMKAEHAALTKGEAANKKSEEGTVQLVTAGDQTVKRKLPTAPQGFKLTPVKDFQGWTHGMLAMIEWVGRVRDEEVAANGVARLTEYKDAMTAMWKAKVGKAPIFLKNFEVFLETDTILRKRLMHERLASWRVTRDTPELGPEFAELERKVQEGLILRLEDLARGRSGPPGGQQRPGGGAPRVAPGGGTGAGGYPAPSQGPTKGDPTTFDECKKRGYLGLKHGTRPYCCKALLGTCTATVRDGFCTGDDGVQRSHNCVRCGKQHKFDGKGACPSPLR